MAGMTFITAFTGANFRTSAMAMAKEFDVSSEVINLGTSLFFFGFLFGPVVSWTHFRVVWATA